MLLAAIGLLVGPQVLDAVDLSSKSSTGQVLAEATLALGPVLRRAGGDIRDRVFGGRLVEPA
jgi:hypothetical protein